MKTPRGFLLAAACVLVSSVGAASSASASTIPIDLAAFGPGSTLTTFAGLANGTEVNGLTVDGILFEYSLGNGILVVGVGGPGTTNNITPPNISSNGNPGGVLTLTLPAAVDLFGYGYALNRPLTDPNATSITLFNGATPIGFQLYTGVPDPLATGGFAGIQSTESFNRVQISFSAVALAFALDNIRTGASVSAVPEPATVVLFGSGMLGMIWWRSRRQKP